MPVENPNDERRRTEETDARIIEAIHALDGGGELHHIHSNYFDMNANWFRPEDLEDIPEGSDIRWRKIMDWGLPRLKKEKIVENPMRGYWQLTPEWMKMSDPSDEFRRRKKFDKASKSVGRLSPQQRHQLLRKLSEESN